MTVAEDLAQIADRNFAYYKARAKNEVEEKCYSCKKWTLYGMTCNGGCVKE